MKKYKPSTPDSDKNAGAEPAAQNAADNPENTDVRTDAASGAPQAETGGGAGISDPCHELRETLAAKEKDFNTLQDKFLRLAAEFDNFRRRTQKEKEAIYGDSIAIVIKEFLPLLDSLDRASQAASQVQDGETGQIAEGIVLMKKQVEQVLARLNVSAIDCVGQPFDPVIHDAVMHVEDESAGAGIVIEELQKGYRRDDRIIRHSVVKVAN